MSAAKKYTSKPATPSEPEPIALAKELATCRVDVLSGRASVHQIATLLDRAARALVGGDS